MGWGRGCGVSSCGCRISARKTEKLWEWMWWRQSAQPWVSQRPLTCSLDVAKMIKFHAMCILAQLAIWGNQGNYMSFELGLLEVEIPFVARNSLEASIRFFMLYQKLTCLAIFPGIMGSPTNVLSRYIRVGWVEGDILTMASQDEEDHKKLKNASHRSRAPSSGQPTWLSGGGNPCVLLLNNLRRPWVLQLSSLTWTRNGWEEAFTW